MFENPGEKLKMVVNALVCLGLGLSAFLGAFLITAAEQVVMGILVIVIGCVMSWVSALVVMVFADIGVNMCKTKEMLARVAATMCSDNEDEIGVGTGSKIVHADGNVSYDNGPEWKCRCGRKNLSSLKHCYYCGADRDKN